MTPAQLGLAGAAQLGLIICTVTDKGKPTTTRLYVVTNREGERMDATDLLLLRRGQWGIEGKCHQRLEVSLHEDQSRVRSLNGAAVLGLLARVSVALHAQARARPGPVRDKTYPLWSERLRHRPTPLLERLLERCLPP